MVQASQIKPHMEVLGSDGAHVGTVDDVSGDRIKLTKADAADHAHHYVALGSVARVDQRVHLSITAAAALAAAAGAIGAQAGHGGPLPPIANPAVEDARPRGNYYLPWILLAIALIAAFLLIRSCTGHPEKTAAVAPAPVAAPPATAPLPVEAVKLPNGTSINLEPQTLNYELQRYLSSSEPVPRTFTFDKLNFNTASSAIRPQDSANVDALAQILSAYPKAKVKIVGYTDTQGTAPANVQLGQQRATSVKDALIAKGVDASRIEAATGGETKPADTNATPSGRFENRRTELTVLAK